MGKKRFAWCSGGCDSSVGCVEQFLEVSCVGMLGCCLGCGHRGQQVAGRVRKSAAGKISFSCFPSKETIFELSRDVWKRLRGSINASAEPSMGNVGELTSTASGVALQPSADNGDATLAIN